MKNWGSWCWNRQVLNEYCPFEFLTMNEYFLNNYEKFINLNNLQLLLLFCKNWNKFWDCRICQHYLCFVDVIIVSMIINGWIVHDSDSPRSVTLPFSNLKFSNCCESAIHGRNLSRDLKSKIINANSIIKQQSYLCQL